jgi:cell division protein FtsN
MRTATLIIIANICAFSLGVVMSLWLLTARPDLVASAMRAAPVASSATERASSPTPPRDALSSDPRGGERSDIASSSLGAQQAAPAVFPAPAPAPGAAPNAASGAASGAWPGANAVVAPIVVPTAADAPPPTTPAAPPDAQAVATAADIPPAIRAAAPSGTVAAVASTGATRHGRYLLQAGAFQDAANATRLVAQLKKLGCDATITPATFGTRTLLLVRIGGFGEYGAVAETASLIRKRIGIPALIVKITQ